MVFSSSEALPQIQVINIPQPRLSVLVGCQASVLLTHFRPNLQKPGRQKLLKVRCYMALHHPLSALQPYYLGLCARLLGVLPPHLPSQST